MDPRDSDQDEEREPHPAEWVLAGVMFFIVPAGVGVIVADATTKGLGVIAALAMFCAVIWLYEERYK